MLSIDGVHLEKDMGLHLLGDSSEPILPDTRDNTVTIPGRHGAYVFDSYLEPRKFFERILIPSQASLQDVQKICRDVSKMLLDSYGKPKDVKLVFDYEPEKYYMARFSGYIAVDRIARAGMFPIPFTAYDPHAYADLTAYDPEETYVYDTGLQYDSGLMYDNPQGFQWTYSKHYSSAYNYSYYNTGLKLMIEGDVINPRITNLTTGESITIGGQYTSSERIYIDTDKLLLFKVDLSIEGNYFLSPNFIYQHKKEISKGNLFSKYSGNLEKLNLVPGDNGLLFEGGLPNASVTYYWEHKFL